MVCQCLLCELRTTTQTSVPPIPGWFLGFVGSVTDEGTLPIEASMPVMCITEGKFDVHNDVHNMLQMTLFYYLLQTVAQLSARTNGELRGSRVYSRCTEGLC